MANPLGMLMIFWVASRLAESHKFEMSKVGPVVCMVGVLDWHFERLLWECLFLYEMYISSCYRSEEGCLITSLNPFSSTRCIFPMPVNLIG